MFRTPSVVRCGHLHVTKRGGEALSLPKPDTVASVKCQSPPVRYPMQATQGAADSFGHAFPSAARLSWSGRIFSLFHNELTLFSYIPCEVQRLTTLSDLDLDPA
jgi:hypothetical protein